MHNSNNSAVRKDYFTGTLIAQARLLGFQTDLNQVKPSELNNIINKQIASKVSNVPTFFESQIERTELSEETKETFARIGARARREFIEEQTARRALIYLSLSSFRFWNVELFFYIIPFVFPFVASKRSSNL